MASHKDPDLAPEERLEAERLNLEYLALACGEEAGLHRPLNDGTGGVITGIPEEVDLAQALSDRETSDLLVHLLAKPALRPWLVCVTTRPGEEPIAALGEHSARIELEFHSIQLHHTRAAMQRRFDFVRTAGAGDAQLD